jgi:RNA polymerase sigma-70 factor (ECF subfamily)
MLRTIAFVDPRYNPRRPAARDAAAQSQLYITGAEEPEPVVAQQLMDEQGRVEKIAPPAVIADGTLLARMRGGDISAGEELVRRYYPTLIRYLQRLTASDTLAEELHQQTWLSVLEHLEKFEANSAGGGFKAWLFRIATNKANDHWRSAGREKAAKDGLRLVTDEALPAADHRLEATEQQHKLAAAIRQLPEIHRRVLLLRYYSGLKFIEIAQVIGCPLNTALGRMHKAMLKLRELMA